MVQASPSLQEQSRQLNPDVDRMPALKGTGDESKFKIVLNQPGGKTLTFDYLKGKTAKFDWDDPKWVLALNKWRQQTFK